MLALESSTYASPIHTGTPPAFAHQQYKSIEALIDPANFSVTSSKTFYYDHLKRSMDIFSALFLLGSLAPIFLLVAVVIKLTSPGPIIFVQRRLTAGKREFQMLKFRTMAVDAESTTGAVWAKKKDPRVTRVGRWLRLTRIDELPQLVNVLIGDMSLIGPRPERPEFAEELASKLPAFHRRTEVKAGITGLAQIAGGYASSIRSYRRKLALDIKYIENRSLLLDLIIALKTVMVVITGTGAR